MSTTRRVLGLAFLFVAFAGGCTSTLDLDSYQITDQARCGPGLVDLQTDIANCGQCGNACLSGGLCVSGSCTCTGGKVDCGDACVDTKSDSQNCGACGKACDTGTRCEAGVCNCTDASDTVCGTACVNLDTDANNCGKCGTTCASGGTCAAGACHCPGSDVVCGGACTALDSDPNNCGACGQPCSVANASASCTKGKCAAATCQAGYKDCNSDLSKIAAGNGCETHTDSDPANCGACRTACTAGQVCTGGQCVCNVPAEGGVCDPRTNCGCTNGLNCVRDTGTWQCEKPGTVAPGASCTSNASCTVGYACVGAVCSAYCDPKVATCSDGSNCLQVSDSKTMLDVDGWGACKKNCNPVTSFPNPGTFMTCAPGQKCEVYSDGPYCSATVGPGGFGSTCSAFSDCVNGFGCNNSACAPYCWKSGSPLDTCSQYGGYTCQSFSTPLMVQGQELGICGTKKGTAGCKQPCSVDADCSVSGTSCQDTDTGYICLNTECATCFNERLQCVSNNTTCAFDNCQ
jgi:hypothetical protein